MASRARSTIAANGPISMFAAWLSMPACGRVGAIDSASSTALRIRSSFSASSLLSLSQLIELFLLLGLGVGEHLALEDVELRLEGGRIDVERLELREDALALVLFAQPLLHDGLAVGKRAPRGGVDDLFLRRLVDGQHPPERDERLRAVRRARHRHAVEHRLDLLVLVLEERDDVAAGLDRRGHWRGLSLFR